MADWSVPIGDASVTTGEWIEVRAPFDDALLGRVPACGPEQVDDAVHAARAALDGGPLPAWQRAEILDRAAQVVGSRIDELARVIATEAAKPIKTARVEAERAVSTFTFAAVAARTLAGDVVPMEASVAGAGKLAFTLRVPIGVVGAISPFNFPLNLVAHKLAPAIAAGCPVVLKPASQTPRSALTLARILLDECGLPAGHLNVVTGGGGTVGNAIVDHPDIALITFTGSPEVGWGIKSRAPRKKVGLELGNNAPLIIEPSADVETAAQKVSIAGFSHAGQSCISTQRIYVHASVHERFLDALVPLVEGLVVGDPLDEQTDVSALISPGERDRVQSWVDDAVAAGAEILTGGKVREDGLLAPTVLGGVTPDMRVCADEVFGPVVGIAAYTDLDDALHLANNSRYGLQAAIFTTDLTDALHAARTLDYGGVLINESTHLPRRPTALRRQPRQRQHPRRTPMGRTRDDRGTPRHHPNMIPGTPGISYGPGPARSLPWFAVAEPETNASRGASDGIGAVTPEILDSLQAPSAGSEGSVDGEQVSRPTKLIRIASMVRALLDEARLAQLDDAGRRHLKEIHERSLHELEGILSDDLRKELAEVTLPFSSDTPSDAELRIAQAQLVGWLEGLFHGIQATLFTQQMQAQQQFEEMRQRRALESGGRPPGAYL